MSAPLRFDIRAVVRSVVRSVVRLLVWLLAAIGALTAAGGVGAAAPCWLPPVVGTVTDPYRQPPCVWCAGNRGIEYRVGNDVVIRAAAGGRVEFVGTVVDVRYVVVRLANGWRHTYGRLASTPRRTGDVVFAGSSIGRVSGTFFFGLRIGDDYADPAPFLGERRGRPRLVPIDGPARPSRFVRAHCPASDERTGRMWSVRSSVSVVAGAR